MPCHKVSVVEQFLHVCMLHWVDKQSLRTVCITVAISPAARGREWIPQRSSFMGRQLRYACCLSLLNLFKRRHLHTISRLLVLFEHGGRKRHGLHFLLHPCLVTHRLTHARTRFQYLWLLVTQRFSDLNFMFEKNKKAVKSWSRKEGEMPYLMVGFRWKYRREKIILGWGSISQNQIY